MRIENFSTLAAFPCPAIQGNGRRKTPERSDLRQEGQRSAACHTERIWPSAHTLLCLEPHRGLSLITCTITSMSPGSVPGSRKPGFPPSGHCRSA